MKVSSDAKNDLVSERFLLSLRQIILIHNNMSCSIDCLLVRACLEDLMKLGDTEPIKQTFLMNVS